MHVEVMIAMLHVNISSSAIFWERGYFTGNKWGRNIKVSLESAAYKTKTFKCSLTEVVERLLHCVDIDVCLHLNESLNKGIAEGILRGSGKRRSTTSRFACWNSWQTTAKFISKMAARWQRVSCNDNIFKRQFNVFIPAALAKFGWVTRQTSRGSWRIRSSPRSTSLDLQTHSMWNWPGKERTRTRIYEMAEIS